MQKTKNVKKVMLFLMAVVLLTVFQSKNVHAAEGKLAEGKYLSGACSEEKFYLKFTVSKTGLVKFQYEDNLSDGSIRSIDIYNKNKKILIENLSMVLDNKETFYTALKKGTYYLGMDHELDFDVDEEEEEEAKTYKVKYTLSPMDAGKKVTAYNKAINLKKGKKVKGLVFATDKTAKGSSTVTVYKFKVDKKRKVKLQIQTKKNHSMRGVWVQIFDAKGNHPFGDNLEDIRTYENGTYKETLKKGTYYLAVRRSENSSGFYSIKWK